MNWLSKPPLGAQLNRASPLCPDVLCALLNEGAGLLTSDLVQGRRGVITDGIWSGGSRGIVRAHTAVTDRVNFGTDAFLPATQATVVIGYRKRDATLRNAGAFGSSLATGVRFGVHLPFSDGSVYWDYGTIGAGGRLTVAGLTVGDDIWVFTTGPRGMEVWQNGILRGSQGTSSVFTPGTLAAEFFLGAYNGSASDLADFQFCYVYSTQLSQDNVRAVSASPFSMLFSTSASKVFISPDRSLSVFDAITVTEQFSTAILTVSVSDSIGITENVAMATFVVSVADSTTVSESVSVSLQACLISVADSVSTTDVTSFPGLQVSVFETISLIEAFTVASFYPPLVIDVFDVIITLPDSVELSLIRTVSGNALIIGGTTYLFDENSPANISKRTSDAWSANFSMVYTSGSKPEPNQEIEFFWASVKRFGGIVQSTTETRIMGPTNQTRIVVQCTGYQSLLNRAIVAKLYTLAISGWPIMIFDIWFRHLQDFGITLAYPQGPLTGFEPHLFHYRTVAECFNVCRDENAGVDYWITDNKALVFANFGAGGAAPFTLRNGDVNQSSVTVTTSAKKFRNKQWVLPSVPLTSLLEEPPVTTTANQIVFETQYAQDVAPVVTLDAVEEDVTTLGNWDGSPWYYIPGGIGVFRTPGAPAITGGQTVTITYPNPFPLAYSAQDDASIAAVGLYESIYQAKNIVDQPTAEAFAAALLEAYGTNGLFPESIRFTYNSCNASSWTGQTAWLLPGMVVDVDRTFPNALGDYVVEEVNSQLECFTIWRHSVTLRLGKGDVSESFEADFLRGTRLWVNDPPIRVTIELDLTGAGNVVGVQPQFYTFMGQGIIASWDAQFGVGYEPTGEDFIIDLLYEGVSIFPSGDANKIVVPDGSTAQAGGFVFTSNNLGYTDAAKLTMNIIQAAGTRYGVIHLNLKPNTALPPA